MKKILFLLLIPAGLLHGQPRTDQQSATLLDSVLNVYSQKKMFNGSVLVAKNGKVLLSKGYGSASFTFDIPNKPSTKFRLASVTKQFTAMAIMMLEEQGKLSVNDPLSKFIPDYPNGSKITIHQLLNHTSGIPNLTNNPRFDSIKMFAHTPDEVIALFKFLPFDFEPGQQFRYSNSGYILLSRIIEKTSGTSYAEFISKNIFEKLGMHNSGYCSNTILMKDFAEGYTQTFEGYQKAAYIDMSIPLGAGGLCSTVEDMYLWERALNSDQLVKKKTLDKIFTPSADGMGYGWYINSYHDSKMIFHGGRIEGFSTSIQRFPEQDLCIIILKNVDNQTYFSAKETATMIMFNDPFELPVEHVEIPVDASLYKKLAGQYEIDSTFAFTVTDSLGHLYIQAPGEPQFQLHPEAAYRYFLFEVNATIEFVMNKQGEAESLVLKQDGQEIPGKRK